MAPLDRSGQLANNLSSKTALQLDPQIKSLPSPISVSELEDERVTNPDFSPIYTSSEDVERFGFDQEIESPSSFVAERRKILQMLEDSLPHVVKSMDSANVRIHGYSVAGQAADELLQSWGKTEFGKTYP
jgi:hypothetical protein